MRFCACGFDCALLPAISSNARRVFGFHRRVCGTDCGAGSLWLLRALFLHAEARYHRFGRTDGRVLGAIECVAFSCGCDPGHVGVLLVPPAPIPPSTRTHTHIIIIIIARPCLTGRALLLSAVLSEISSSSIEQLTQSSHSLREVTHMMLSPADPKQLMATVHLGVGEGYVSDFLNFLLASLNSVRSALHRPVFCLVVHRRCFFPARRFLCFHGFLC
jgi:hypothetical protein